MSWHLQKKCSPDFELDFKVLLTVCFFCEFKILEAYISHEHFRILVVKDWGYCYFQALASLGIL